MGEGSPNDDFTERSYRAIVSAASARYSFEPFGTDSAEPHVLWRHDVDFSVHRALALARIEAEAGVRATYLFSLRSAFYNLLEEAVLSPAREIAALGHWAGLHFDLGAHAGAQIGNGFERSVSFERDLLSELLAQPVETVSFHNPSATGADTLRADVIAAMVNAYGERIAGRYHYVSDSNGYWRHERLSEVIDATEHERLHVLTHPEWWSPEALSPRARMERCIEGRTVHTREWYEGPVRKWKRKLPG